MITYVVGDLFQSPAKVLVNAVNTVGVMGAGIAAEFKSYYPEMFEQYQGLCADGKFNIGNLWLYKTPHKWVLNFPTKQHWRNRSDLDFIEKGLQKFAASYAESSITSVSFPTLGSGEGKLDWHNEVRPLMEAYLNPLPIAVYIHRYDPAQDERRSPRAIRAWLNGQPQVVEFYKFWRDLARAVKRNDRFQTGDGSATFRVVVDDAKRRSVTLYPPGAESIFLPETMLVDLWLYVREAGYVMPHNLPGGMDIHAPFLFGLLAGVDYIRPVSLSWDDNHRYDGLHFIPPLDKRADPFVHTVKISETV